MNKFWIAFDPTEEFVAPQRVEDCNTFNYTLKYDSKFMAIGETLDKVMSAVPNDFQGLYVLASLNTNVLPFSSLMRMVLYGSDHPEIPIIIEKIFTEKKY